MLQSGCLYVCTHVCMFVSMPVRSHISKTTRPGKADANRVYTQRESPGAEPGANADVYTFLVLLHFLNFRHISRQ